MDSELLLRLVMAFVFTLSLLGLCAWLVARLGRNVPLLNRNNPNSRLGVIEWKPVDARHQLVLVRRDKTEHLLLLSANGHPQIIERNIENTPASEAPVS